MGQVLLFFGLPLLSAESKASTPSELKLLQNLHKSRSTKIFLASNLST